MKTILKRLLAALAAALATAVVLGLFVAMPALIYGPLTGKPATATSIERRDEAGTRVPSPAVQRQATPARQTLPAQPVLMFILVGWVVVELLLAVGSIFLRERRKSPLYALPYMRIRRESVHEAIPGSAAKDLASPQQGAAELGTAGQRVNINRRRASDHVVSATPIEAV